MYDVIIVGARCGGSPIALQLAREGFKVLIVDRMTLGSDIMSTHYLKRSGGRLLKKWGLLGEIEKLDTPPIRQLNFHINDTKISGTAPPLDGLDCDYAPRRFYLDKILTDAAIAAGAEAREKFTVNSLLFDDGRVVGIRGMHEGKEVTEKAKLVIGADGANSIVAREAQAETYIDAGTHTCGYYCYYSGLRDQADEANLFIRSEERRFYITFPTNDGLDMLFLFWPNEEVKKVRGNLDNAFNESLAIIPELQDRVSQATRETRISGTHLLPNYFRRANGPGWALVGDAALHRDPITAQGITNAFTHADVLGEELLQALGGNQSIDQATANYDARQLQLLRPMFDYTVHLATLQPLPAELSAMLPVLAQEPAAASAFIGGFIGSVPIQDVMPPQLMKRFADDVTRTTMENQNAR